MIYLKVGEQKIVDGIKIECANVDGITEENDNDCNFCIFEELVFCKNYICTAKKRLDKQEVYFKMVE